MNLNKKNKKTTKMSEIARFLEAQEKDYDRALKEIKNGKKESCWIWYIFPQVKGLGSSFTSEEYGIKDIEEAKEYLENETLKSHLIEITQALLDLEEDNIDNIMHYPDNLKLKSSMTLFKKVEETYNIDCGNIFQKTLDKFFNGEEDQNTIRILEKQKFEKLMGEKKVEENNINNENNDLEIKETNEVIPINEKEDTKEDLKNKGYDFNFGLNNKVEEMNAEPEKEDEMKIEEETNEIKENDIENNNNKHIEDDIDSFKDKNDDMEIIEEKDDMVIKEENINLLDEDNSKKKLSDVNNNNDNNNSDTNLTKRKSVHFSLPSRSQMKNMDNNGNKKSDVEMMIDNNTLENKNTVVIYPYDETEEKKCCPDCSIF
jgi:uncharacterized protein (DUF1810 family)